MFVYQTFFEHLLTFSFRQSQSKPSAFDKILFHYFFIVSFSLISPLIVFNRFHATNFFLVVSSYFWCCFLLTKHQEYAYSLLDINADFVYFGCISLGFCVKFPAYYKGVCHEAFSFWVASFLILYEWQKENSSAIKIIQFLWYRK